MSQKSRLGTIVKVIGNSPGITLNQLCAQLSRLGIKVTERTVAKDIFLLKSEYQLLPQRERLRRGYVLENIATLSQDEIRLVLDALHVFGVQFDAPEARVLVKRLQDRVRQATPQSSRLRTVRQRNIYPKGTATRQIEQMLLEAIRTHVAVTLQHQPALSKKTEQISGYPLLMIFHERGWYCLMRELQQRRFLPFRLDRIKSCVFHKTAAPNKNHEDDVAECEFLLSAGWGMAFPSTKRELEIAKAQPPIVVRFDSTVAPFILESMQRHPFATVSPTKDGTGDVHFQIRLGTPREFLFWLRSFGSHAWIVSPRSLASAERSEALRLAERYKP
jgi:predicted DNA-binding transcriptional regulator YafY